METHPKIFDKHFSTVEYDRRSETRKAQNHGVRNNARNLEVII